MTDKEFSNEISQYPLTTIATVLLKLENNRESALDKTTKEAETDSLKLSDDERRKQFGARLRKIRQLLGLTQAELAEKIGMSKQAITLYETGRREASYKSLVALSRALNVTTDWLLDAPPPISQ